MKIIEVKVEEDISGMQILNLLYNEKHKKFLLNLSSLSFSKVGDETLTTLLNVVKQVNKILEKSK